VPDWLDREERPQAWLGVHAADSGGGSLLLIEGSAGLGKTRLAGLAAERARGSVAGVLQAGVHAPALGERWLPAVVASRLVAR
jgi:hypothetical protein